MKPSFALSLSFEGIALLHRSFPGWNRVGEVALDSSDLNGALAVLRETAQQINGKDLTSKLVIPNDQIKYLALDLGLTDEDARQDAIRAALDGATPYPVADLVFDWSVEGDKTLVAAVARETLTEAEQFAMEHGFGPMSFVAIPDEGQFSGEPFFGPTAHARKVLAKDETVQRDMAPIRVTGVARLPEPETEAEPEDIATGDAPDTPPAAEAAGTETAAAPQDLTPVQPDDGASQDAVSEDSTDAPETAETGPGAVGSQDEAGPGVIPAFSTIRARRDDIGDSGAAMPALSGARRGRDGPVSDDMTAPVIPIEADAQEITSATPPVAAPASDLQDEADRPEPYGEPQAAEIPPAPADLPDRDPVAPPVAEAPREDRLSFLSRRDRPVASLAANSAAVDMAELEQDPEPALDPASEKERMTIYGARRSEAATQSAIGGKPRYLGLIMTAVLLLFLAGVAAWASIFVDEGLSRFFGPRDTAVTSLPRETMDELSAEGDEATVPAQPQPDAPPDAVETAALDIWPDEAEAPPALSEPQPPRAMTPDEAQTRYAVTGVWLRAPDPPTRPAQGDLDDLYVASIDPRVEEHDAVALPEMAALQTDIAMAPPAPPLPKGSEFDLDARGLVVASEEGTLSPEGFLVFAGRPEATPGSRPERAPDAAETAAEDARAELVGIRPRPRPEGLIEENERQNLGGITWAEVAQVRPRPRPEQIAAKIEEEADTTATQQAVPESRKPEPRPNNFARVVERAQDSEPQEATRVAAAVPRQQAVAPSIPSRSNVAKAATVRNQLNLRKVNLIGVYGKPSSRRALVRLSNGRYKKVKVGDRLDGGRVQAIGEAELRYQKSGRNVILQLPKG